MGIAWQTKVTHSYAGPHAQYKAAIDHAAALIENLPADTPNFRPDRLRNKLCKPVSAYGPKTRIEEDKHVGALTFVGLLALARDQRVARRIRLGS